jgi:hypothetical protein
MTIKRKILLSLCAIIVLSIATGVIAIFNKLHHLDTYKNNNAGRAESPRTPYL